MGRERVAELIWFGLWFGVDVVRRTESLDLFLGEVEKNDVKRFAGLPTDGRRDPRFSS